MRRWSSPARWRTHRGAMAGLPSARVARRGRDRSGPGAQPVRGAPSAPRRLLRGPAGHRGAASAPCAFPGSRPACGRAGMPPRPPSVAGAGRVRPGRPAWGPSGGTPRLGISSTLVRCRIGPPARTACAARRLWPFAVPGHEPRRASVRLFSTALSTSIAPHTAILYFEYVSKQQNSATPHLDKITNPLFRDILRTTVGQKNIPGTIA